VGYDVDSFAFFFGGGGGVNANGQVFVGLTLPRPWSSSGG